jgi:site-specific DNA-methyltransferase (adenine-specific)/adenine-specific DNA-methyltransferase
MSARATPAPNVESASPIRLSWAGRKWEPGAASSSALPPALSVVEVHRPLSLPIRASRGVVPTLPARLVHADALDLARALARAGLAGKVDTVYVDPPFGSQSAYVHEARIDGRADGRVVRATAYDDRWDDSLGPYLDMLAPRLEALARLLAPTGTLWVHVDYRASYLVRVLLDEILGRGAFVNEITWRRAPNLGRQAASHQFGRTLDTIVVYGGPAARLAPPTRLEPIEPKAIRWDEQGRPFTSAPRGDYTDESIARLDREGRVHRTASGKVYVKYFLVKDGDGAFCRERRVDALWTDVAPLRHAARGERTGFPTQKPRALLDRSVACASPPGGLVVDAFCGSGTLGESAHALGRRFVIGDASALAVATARARLMRAGAPLQVERCDGVEAPEGPAPRAEATREPEGLRVALREPKEPLAWAIDVSGEVARGPFVTAWSSERAPGAKARAAQREVLLPGVPGPARVRVFYDDGRVGTSLAAPGLDGSGTACDAGGRVGQ